MHASFESQSHNNTAHKEQQAYLGTTTRRDAVAIMLALEMHLHASTTTFGKLQY